MLVAAYRITKFYGKQDLFRAASFHIQFGEKVGLVGPNGSGKTTLLRILVGEVAPDEGEIHRARHIRIGYLPQDILALRGRTVLEQVLEVAEEARSIEREMKGVEQELAVAAPTQREALAERLAQLTERYQFLGGYELRPKAEKILMGLGFGHEDLERSVDTLSGGWSMRVAMGRLLLSDPDLLLLDEPTNHLDLEALRWLEAYLVQVNSAVLLISHDRTFLNRMVSRILDIEEGEIISYTGNYDAYREQKRQREAQLWAAYRTQQEQIRQLERFIQRNRARKDRARQVQSRIRALERMERIEPPRRAAELNFRFSQAPSSGRLVARLEGITQEFNERLLYEEASLNLHRGDRVAVVGPNGSGKSTLLKILAGQLEPSRGTRRIGHGVAVGYFAQHQMELLDPEKTALQEVMDSAIHPQQGEIRTLLGAFQIRGDAVFKRVKVLSGGERSRLLLCRILLSGCNFLLMDEPTNHLDITSREALEEALTAFQGTLCLVTHDRRLMNAVANQILVMRPGGWELLPGNFDDYERSCLGAHSTSTPAAAESERAPRKDRERKRKEAAWRNRFYRLKAPVEEAIEKIEQEVEDLTGRLEEIESEMGNAELYRFPDRVKLLSTEYRAVRERLDGLTRQWEEGILELEALNEQMERERPS